MSRLEQAVHLSAPAAGFQPASSGRIWYTLYAPYTQSCPTVLRTASAAGSFFSTRKRRWLFLRTAMRRVRSSVHPATLRHNLALAKLSRRPRLWRFVRSSWAPERVVLQAKTLVAAARGRRLAWCPIPGWSSRATAARSDRPSDRGTYTLPMPLCHCRTGRPGKRLPPVSARGRRPAAFAGQASRPFPTRPLAEFVCAVRRNRPDKGRETGGEGKGAPVPLARVVSHGKPT